MSIRIAILDDEPLAVEILTDFVHKTPGLDLVTATTQPFELINTLEPQSIEVVLLDIQMPELTGIQFMKLMGDRCKYIITSAYDEFALQGYEYNVVDYLLKPISYERFFKAIEKLKTVSPKAQLSGKLMVKSGTKIYSISKDEILYIQSEADYVAYHCIHKKKILALDTLQSLEIKLSPDFIRVHRSYIVSLSKIDFIEKNQIVLCDATRIPISAQYKETFWEIWEG